MADDRFSDKEVSVVLRRAAEIDATGVVSSSGMTVADIEAVAAEAGIAAEAVRRALSELGGEVESDRGGLLAPTSHRISRKIPVPMDREQLSHMVAVIEDSARRPGQVTEALGAVRWTSQEQGRSTTQVTLTPIDGGTQLSVHERVSDSIRRVFHVLPTLWGGMLGIGLSAGGDLGAVGSLLIALGSVAGGFGIGRTAFSWLSSRSRKRVEALARELEDEGRRLLPATPAPDQVDGDS